MVSISALDVCSYHIDSAQQQDMKNNGTGFFIPFKTYVQDLVHFNLG